MEPNGFGRNPKKATLTARSPIFFRKFVKKFFEEGINTNLFPWVRRVSASRPAS